MTNTDAATILRDALTEIMNVNIGSQPEFDQHENNAHIWIAYLKRVCSKALDAAERAAIQPAGDAVAWELEQRIPPSVQWHTEIFRYAPVPGPDIRNVRPLYAAPIPQQAKAEQVEPEPTMWLVGGHVAESPQERDDWVEFFREKHGREVVPKPISRTAPVPQVAPALTDDQIYEMAEKYDAVVVCNGEGDYNGNVEAVVKFGRALLATAPQVAPEQSVPAATSGREAIMWIVFAEHEGKMVPQYPASFKREESEYNARTYGQTKTEVRGLFDAPQPQEQNFCARCGKRNVGIHTCTPPGEEVAPEQASVLTPDVLDEIIGDVNQAIWLEFGHSVANEGFYHATFPERFIAAIRALINKKAVPNGDSAADARNAVRGAAECLYKAIVNYEGPAGPVPINPQSAMVRELGRLLFGDGA